MDFDLENPLTAFQDHHLPPLFASESDHTPNYHYKSRDSDLALRRDAVSMIFQLSGSFDRFVQYLAVNYFDRFVSAQGMPRGEPWILRLVAISCVSLAAKMKQVEFSLTDFQRDGRFIFDVQTIQRMEVLILGALKWRMRSVTPFSFLHFFISLLQIKDSPQLQECTRNRAVEIIFRAQSAETVLICFKPSMIAASALLCAAHDLFPSQRLCFMNVILSCEYVNKETLLDCHNAMGETLTDGFESSSLDSISGSDTPVSVLHRHRHCSSSETTTTPHEPSKRRKICDFRLSQIQHC
ncbi:hypothetical protein Sjap_025453 [Stephania japonica]|uniref:Cyclin-D6-1 n=1 Tax=Stephania japonica TaxID=461633 RepID=A0AAP0E584_9MAGN